jgi:hypothetical protein
MDGKMRTGLAKKLGIGKARRTLRLFSSLQYRAMKAAIVTRRERHTGDFYVSLTSYPKRFERLHLTIQSLLAQTILPRKITLYLSSEEVEQSGIPRTIRKLESELFQVCVVENNYRPYNKFIHALREHPQERIITVDDDRHYRDDLFETLYRASTDHPSAIICWAGRHIGVDEAGKLLPYSKWSLSHIAGRAVLPLGCAGVLYPPNSLHRDADRSSIFMELAPTTDDLWFKVMSYLQGTPVVSLYRSIKDFPEITTHPAISLWSVNRLGADDSNIVRLLDHYRIDARHFAGKPQLELARIPA